MCRLVIVQKNLLSLMVAAGHCLLLSASCHFLWCGSGCNKMLNLLFFCYCCLFPGDTRLFVCSNDDSIKVYSLPAMQNICTIR